MTLVLHIRDSRRLTGPSRFWDLPSAILDVGAPVLEFQPTVPSSPDLEPELYFECPAEQLVTCWELWARRVLDGVGWQSQDLTSRVFADGASLLISAPIDALYAATEVNEFVFNAALADLLRGQVPNLDQEAARLRRLIAEEANPRLLHLEDGARARKLLFLSDDDHASIGAGRGSQTWPVSALPSPESLPLDECHNIKTVAISGTNGKSTTVRLLSFMAASTTLEGRPVVPGTTSTDWIRVGTDVVDEGDYSGPNGARTVLRDTRVDIAMLEAARGGLNRRGLGVPSLDVAVLTNIGTDHLGEHGSNSLDDLLDVKWTIARVAQHVVLNADDPLLTVRGQAHYAPGSPDVTWFSLDSRNRIVGRHAEGGGSAVVLEGKNLIAVAGSHQEQIANVDDIPIAMEGVARHNIANALAAAAAARALGFNTKDIEGGLRTFGRSHADNPGRLSLFTFTSKHSNSLISSGLAPLEGDRSQSDRGDLKVLIDFAHNPEGFEQLLAVAESLTPERMLVSLGQAGDRSDAEIQQLAEVASRYRPDRVLIKELDAYRRGREPGAIPALLEERLIKRGTPATSISQTANEMDTVATALRWARGGDLLVLAVHADRDQVVDALTKLETVGWRAETDLPGWFPVGVESPQTKPSPS